MRKFTLLLALLALGVGTTWAQQVSVAEAMARAKAFVQSGSNGRAKAAAKAGDDQLSLAYTCKDKAEKNVCYYVFNDGNGFVIVGGDEAAQQILGYSDNGAFDYDKAPENMKWWLSQYQQQISAAISYAEANPEAAKAARAKAARKKAGTKADIAQKMSTEWNQTSPYNRVVNAAFKDQTGVDVDLATGCVATAMAQVLYNHQGITKGSGSATGTTRSYEISGSTYSFTPEVTFLEKYDWNNMKDDISNLYMDDWVTAISTLMYHAGVSVDMKYGNSSSASLSKVPAAMADHFGYDKSIRYVERKYYDDDEWEDMIYNELNDNGPVIYGGQDKNSSSGHCFVCDGYQASGNTYHINWGWGGYCDTYFKLTGTNALAPGGSGAGGAGETAEYSKDQEAVINVKAPSTNLETPVLHFTGLEAYLDENFVLSDGSTTTRAYEHAHGTSKTVALTESVANFSRSLTSFSLGVKATEVVTGLEYIFPAGKTADLTYLQGKNLTADFDVDDLPFNGTYEINMVARNTASTSANDWYEVCVESSISKPTVTVTGATDPTKTDLELTISNDEVQVSRTIQVEHTSAYKGAITYTSSNTSVATVDENGVVTGVKAGTATITATAAGNSYFFEKTETFDIKVLPLVKTDPVATLSATCIAVGETAQIILPEDYDGYIKLSMVNDASVATLSDRTVTGVGAGTAKITLYLSESDFYNSSTVSLTINVTGDDIYFTEAPYFSNDNNIWSGDGLLHYSIKNNSTSAKTNLYFVMKFYKKEADGTYSYDDDYDYFTFTKFPASYTASGSYDIMNNMAYFFKTDNTQYKVEFYKDAAMTNAWNIPSITFTYRASLSHEYTITDAGVGTLILPFNAEIPTKDDSNNAISWKAYECLGMDGSTLVLNEVTSMKRNTPYIITGDAATYTFNGPKAVDDTPVLFGNGVLKGTMLDTYLFQTGDYILQNLDNGAAFYKYDSSVKGASSWKATPCRAFLQLDGSSSLQCAAIPGFTKDITTGINAVTGTTKAAGIYTVGGTKVSQLQPGLNIIVDEQGNAVKVFIKK